ncbi:acyltransferase domain-containing protein [Marinactinospora thermotolerans]|nr:acyltransferase domain-containing protein [Marinactinospora thermotolerans]AET51848.1 acyltransferase [Marinactinospora thermotolerans]
MAGELLEEGDRAFAGEKARQRDVEELAHRLAVLGSDPPGMLKGLRLFLEGVPDRSWASGRAAYADSPVAWCFGGHGGQWAGMGSDLVDSIPAGAETLARIDSLFRAESGFGLVQMLREARERPVDDLAVVQPLIFAVQVAIARTLLTHGLRPDLVVGYSMGEIAAAHVAGALTLSDAVRVMYHRSRLLAATPAGGRMLVARGDTATTERACAESAGAVSIAALSSPGESVLTGDADALRRLVERWEPEGLRCRWVRIDAASHSPAVEGVLDELRGCLRDVRPRAPRLRWVSTVDPDPAVAPWADPCYWARNLREPVRFAPVVAALLDEGVRMFVEIGPHPVLRVPLQGNIRAAGTDHAKVVVTGRRGMGERSALLRAVAELYCHGVTGADRRVLLDLRAGPGAT